MDLIIKKLEEQISFLKNDVNQMSKEKFNSIETNVVDVNSIKDPPPPHY